MSDKIDAVGRYARDLAAAAYPRVEQLPGLSGFRRKWILRTKADLPVGQTLQEVTASFVLSARQEIAKAAAQGPALDYPLPAASAIRLDAHHVVLEIDCPTVPDMGDAPLITTSV